MSIAYPVRAVVIDADGMPFHGWTARTPDVSRPHIGKQGLAEKVRGDVRLTLDDGTVLWGWECWWKPVAAQVTP